jgi:putative membrane protein
MPVTQTAPASNRNPIAGIIGLSLAATLFLFWLIYVHTAPQAFATRLLFLPAMDALLNGLAAICLIVGFFFITRRNIKAHRRSMMTAFVFSSLFLVCYILNHALHGDTLYQGHGPLRTVYFAILISHISLCIVALPMVLITFFFSLTGRFPQHKKIARFTLPIWLYVSVTGVIVFAMLHAGAK